MHQLKNVKKIEKQLDKDFARSCDLFHFTSDIRLGDSENNNWYQVEAFDLAVKGLETTILASNLKFESTNMALTKNYYLSQNSEKIVL